MNLLYIWSRAKTQSGATLRNFYRRRRALWATRKGTRTKTGAKSKKELDTFGEKGDRLWLT